MISEIAFRIAFLILLLALLAMRVCYMIKVRRSGHHLMPEKQAIVREGGLSVFIFRVVLFLVLITFLVMCFSGATWIDMFSFHLPDWLRWTGFILGVYSVGVWSWTQIHLDTQWSAQLQLKQNHHLVTTGPYARIRHPLYMSMLFWCASITLLTANWIFAAMCIIAIAGILFRVPKEEWMMFEAFGNEYKRYMERTGRYFSKL